MRVLIVDDAAKAAVERVIAYARTHIYDLAIPSTVPGDNPNFVADLSTYRCVFTFTKEAEPHGKLYCHLSISVSSDGYPHPVAVTEIAGLFGFTEAEKGIESRLKDGAWAAMVKKDEHCIVLAEELR